MAGRLRRNASAITAQMPVGMPTTGMQPTTNPIASVSASRWGEMPWLRHTEAFRRRVSRNCIGSLTTICTQIGVQRIQRTVKLLYAHHERQLGRVEIYGGFWGRGVTDRTSLGNGG